MDRCLTTYKSNIKGFDSGTKLTRLKFGTPSPTQKHQSQEIEKSVVNRTNNTQYSVRDGSSS